MKTRTSWILLTVGAASLASASCITESGIRRELDEAGGTELTAPNQFDVGGVGQNQGFKVGQRVNETQGRGIHITYQGQCQEYCWAQTMREEIDGEAVDSYSEALPDPLLPNGTLTAEAQRSIAARQDATKTADGTTVDTIQDTNNPCQLHANRTGDFTDFPGTGDDTFHGFEKLSITFFETCVKCVRPLPATDWLGCVSWAYLKVKGDEVLGPDQRRLISVTQAIAPTPRFREAVTNWERQHH